MSRSHTALLSVALAATVGGAAIGAVPASAAKTHFDAEQAFKKGIRVTASINHAKASKIRISCKQVPKVDDHGSCTGSFELTRSGRTAHYVLTGKAETIRNSRGSIRYEVDARSVTKVRGLKRHVGASGILQ